MTTTALLLLLSPIIIYGLIDLWITVIGNCSTKDFASALCQRTHMRKKHRLGMSGALLMVFAFICAVSMASASVGLIITLVYLTLIFPT